ncbi:phosphoglycerate dehydrogenase [Streptomyces sp. NRRL S-237]|uniref:phosphoglycerate dehydrogenase n=1 Tax=Streptomyces sp. NRRL S-237 TaxID=1463895 RepID=UPI0004C61B5F|nr:phosphoglycerate dehydrogenase [Streptomyces sp. NRRL S-237]
MAKPIVLIAEELSPTTITALGPDFDIRHCDGTDRPALLSAAAHADALLVRSATRVDAQVIDAARRLKVVARAGVGLDNVDVTAATKAGVLVVNAPLSNVVSAAELTCGLLLSTARTIPQADFSLKSGEWDRQKYTGVELADKTLGGIGLGRIGTLVAQRMSAFGMRILAHDPYATEERALHAGARLVPLDRLLRESDFITVHLPKTPETVGFVGERELSVVKRTVRIVNAARGGIVDEEALAAALKDGRVAGAGLDTFAVEPCTASPLFGLDNVVVTPHLGASTHEAQEKAGTSVAHSVRRALAGELVPDAVNAPGGPVAEEVHPYLALADGLGHVFTELAGRRAATHLEIEVRGEVTRRDVTVLEAAALRGILAELVPTKPSLVNASELAREIGVSVRFSTSSESLDHRNVIAIRGVLPDGKPLIVAGALSARKGTHKLVEIGECDIDLDLTDRMLFLWYSDEPGAIGKAGRILGGAGVNIADMEVARSGGRAMAAMSVDIDVPETVVGSLVSTLDEASAGFVRLMP